MGFGPQAFPGLLRQVGALVYQEDRAVLLLALRALTRLAGTLDNDYAMASLDLGVLARLLPLILLDDEAIAHATLEFLSRYSGIGPETAARLAGVGGATTVSTLFAVLASAYRGTRARTVRAGDWRRRPRLRDGCGSNPRIRPSYKRHRFPPPPRRFISRFGATQGGSCRAHRCPRKRCPTRKQGLCLQQPPHRRRPRRSPQASQQRQRERVGTTAPAPPWPGPCRCAPGGRVLAETATTHMELRR